MSPIVCGRVQKAGTGGATTPPISVTASMLRKCKIGDELGAVDFDVATNSQGLEVKRFTLAAGFEAASRGFQGSESACPAEGLLEKAFCRKLACPVTNVDACSCAHGYSRGDRLANGPNRSEGKVSASAMAAASAALRPDHSISSHGREPPAGLPSLCRWLPSLLVVARAMLMDMSDMVDMSDMNQRRHFLCHVVHQVLMANVSDMSSPSHVAPCVPATFDIDPRSRWNDGLDLMMRTGPRSQV